MTLGRFWSMSTPPQKVRISALSSWKEISAYLGRGVRTVQRWEQELGLPIHRVSDGPRSPVHAFPPEIDAWLLRIDQHRNNGHRNDGNLPFQPRAAVHPDGSSAVARVLVHRSHSLVREMVESLLVQQQRTEKLQKSIENMRKQMQKQMRETTVGVQSLRSHLPE